MEPSTIAITVVEPGPHGIEVTFELAGTNKEQAVIDINAFAALVLAETGLDWWEAYDEESVPSGFTRITVVGFFASTSLVTLDALVQRFNRR